MQGIFKEKYEESFNSLDKLKDLREEMKGLYNQMVGSIYKAVLYDDICEINSRIKDLELEKWKQEQV